MDARISQSAHGNAQVRLQESNRYDSREGGGRVAPGAATESRFWMPTRM